MTDEKIIKALWMCAHTADCGDCPYNAEYSKPCRDKLCADALDLIKEQKAEIEQVKAENQELRRLAGKVKERLESAMRHADTEKKLCAELKHGMFRVRADAITEFAEQLKEHLRFDGDCEYDCEDCCYACKDYVPFIQNMVGEMTAEKGGDGE